MKELLKSWIDINNKIQTELDADISRPMVEEFRSLERFIQEKLDTTTYTVKDILDALEEIDSDIEIEFWKEDLRSPMNNVDIPLSTPVRFMRLYFELVIFI